MNELNRAETCICGVTEREGSTHAIWCTNPVSLGDWVNDARCADSEVSYANRGMCRACPVQRECASYAIRAGITSDIWGGLTSVERDQVERGTVPLEKALAKAGR